MRALPLCGNVRKQPKVPTQIVISLAQVIIEMILLRVPKSQFWLSAPNLSHTCDSIRKE